MSKEAGTIVATVDLFISPSHPILISNTFGQSNVIRHANGWTIHGELQTVFAQLEQTLAKLHLDHSDVHCEMRMDTVKTGGGLQVTVDLQPDSSDDSDRPQIQVSSEEDSDPKPQRFYQPLQPLMLPYVPYYPMGPLSHGTVPFPRSPSPGQAKGHRRNNSHATTSTQNSSPRRSSQAWTRRKSLPATSNLKKPSIDLGRRGSIQPTPDFPFELFIKNLPKNADGDALNHLFVEKLGDEEVQVQIPYHNRSFGYVRFKKEKTMEEALKLTGLTLQDKELVVEKKRERSKSPSGLSPLGPQGVNPQGVTPISPPRNGRSSASGRRTPLN